MNVIILDLPTRIRGFVSRSVEPDGDYDTIVLNARNSAEQMGRTYAHEEGHIKHGDLIEGSVNDIECLRHS